MTFISFIHLQNINISYTISLNKENYIIHQGQLYQKFELHKGETLSPRGSYIEFPQFNNQVAKFLHKLQVALDHNVLQGIADRACFPYLPGWLTPPLPTERGQEKGSTCWWILLRILILQYVSKLPGLVHASISKQFFLWMSVFRFLNFK